QYLVTLSVSGGFVAKEILKEVRTTYCYQNISEEEWQWCLNFIRSGGRSLEVYDEYNRVGLYKGKYYIVNKSAAARHRMSIGTIVSETTMQVKYRNGANIGQIEERFISSLKPGDVFMFSGKTLEVVRTREMEVRVKASKKKKAIVPSWAGGRMPFSSQLSAQLRQQMNLIQEGQFTSIELIKVKPLMELQKQRSHIPAADELVVEYFKDREGYHLVFYPFDGRFVHEGLSALLAWRLSQKRAISFSVAVNDYGFELLTDEEIPVEEWITKTLFNTENLKEHIQQSANAVEMAKRKFRDIASIAGLVFKGFPGRQKRDRHLQASSQLFFDVFRKHEPDNLLLQQAEAEVMQFQLEESRLRATLVRIMEQKLVITRPDRPTPFAFPLMVSRMREKVSSETLKDRVQKMKLRLIK
ncbi:MAG: DNA ligase-associated DEXH box helicase, partial [Bacteroidota bacterium]